MRTTSGSCIWPERAGFRDTFGAHKLWRPARAGSSHAKVRGATLSPPAPEAWGRRDRRVVEGARAVPSAGSPRSGARRGRTEPAARHDARRLHCGPRRLHGAPMRTEREREMSLTQMQTLTPTITRTRSRPRPRPSPILITISATVTGLVPIPRPLPIPMHMHCVSL